MNASKLTPLIGIILLSVLSCKKLTTEEKEFYSKVTRCLTAYVVEKDRCETLRKQKLYSGLATQVLWPEKEEKIKRYYRAKPNVNCIYCICDVYDKHLTLIKDEAFKEQLTDNLIYLIKDSLKHHYPDHKIDHEKQRQYSKEAVTLYKVIYPKNLPIHQSAKQKLYRDLNEIKENYHLID